MVALENFPEVPRVRKIKRSTQHYLPMNTEVALEDLSRRVLIRGNEPSITSTVSFPDPPTYSFFIDPTDKESRFCVTLTSFTSRPGLLMWKERKRQGGKERGRRKQADDGFIFLNFTHQLLELF